MHRIPRSLVFTLLAVVLGLNLAYSGTPPAQKAPQPPRAQPGMVLIPGGTFLMGCNYDYSICYSTEQPPHSVTVNAFFIDKTEVTVSAYQFCVYVGACETPNPIKMMLFDECNWGKENRDAYPMTCINWEHAKAYCQWDGKRLPSEAEFEYASGYADLLNNWEWVEDCWHGNYAKAPTDGRAWVSGLCNERVLRLGSHHHRERLLRYGGQLLDATDDGGPHIGFRCAKSANPEQPETAAQVGLCFSRWDDRAYNLGPTQITANGKSLLSIIGGERKCLRVEQGEYTFMAQSPDPYDPHDKNPSTWQSSPMKVILRPDTTVEIFISPILKGAKYIGPWELDQYPFPKVNPMTTTGGN